MKTTYSKACYTSERLKGEIMCVAKHSEIGTHRIYADGDILVNKSSDKNENDLDATELEFQDFAIQALHEIAKTANLTIIIE